MTSFRSRRFAVILVLLSLTNLKSFNLFAEEPDHSEPNESDNPWAEWADDFTFDWDSITFTTKLYQAPATSEHSLMAIGSYRTLALDTRISPQAPEMLVGLDVNNPFVKRVIDADGNDIPLHTSRNTLRFRPDAIITPIDTSSPYNYSTLLQLTLPNHTPLPSLLSSVEVEIRSFYAWDIIDFNIPLDSDGRWRYVGNRFQIRVLKSERNNLDRHIESEIKTNIGDLRLLNNPTTSVYCGDLADFLLMHVDLLDEDGQRVSKNLSQTHFFSSTGSVYTYTQHLVDPSPSSSVIWWGTDQLSYPSTSGAWGRWHPSPTKEATTIRYTIAVAPYKIIIPFTLVDIPIPSPDQILAGSAPHWPSRSR